MRSLILFLLLFFIVKASAQKLPNKQEASVWAPTNIKIDGKADEWGDKFQAFNRATEIFYTISNDGQNLYLSIQATKPSIIEKLVEGGVEFTIAPNKKQSNIKDLAVLFPLMTMPRCQGILLAAGKQLNAKNYMIHIASEDTAYTLKGEKSISKANGMLGQNLKEIKILGIPEIQDTIPDVTDKTPYYSSLPLRDHQYKIISIANEDEIRANTLFDNEGNCNYELAIPLKYIRPLMNNGNQINYSIIVHGRGEDRRPGDVKQYGPPVNGMKPILYLDLETPTDFSGEYALAKAP